MRILTGVEANVRCDEDGLRGNGERAGDLILKEVAVPASKFESIKDSNCGKNGSNTQRDLATGMGVLRKSSIVPRVSLAPAH